MLIANNASRNNSFSLLSSSFVGCSANGAAAEASDSNVLQTPSQIDTVCYDAKPYLIPSFLPSFFPSTVYLLDLSLPLSSLLTVYNLSHWHRWILSPQPLTTFTLFSANCPLRNYASCPLAVNAIIRASDALICRDLLIESRIRAFDQWPWMTFNRITTADARYLCSSRTFCQYPHCSTGNSFKSPRWSLILDKRQVVL